MVQKNVPFEADEITWHVRDDRRRHERRAVYAIIIVTILCAIASCFFANDGTPFTLFLRVVAGAVVGLVTSGLTAAIINSDHDVYYRRSSSLEGKEIDTVRLSKKFR